MTIRRERATAAAGGLIAAATALSLGYLAADATGGPWPVDAVGLQVIDWTPNAAKDWAVRELGTSDKTILRIAICAVLALMSMSAGVLGLRSRRGAVVIASTLGLVGLGFALLGRSATASAVTRVLPAVVTLLVAVVAMYLVVRSFRRPSAAGTESAGGEPATADELDAPAGFDRRRFLLTTTAVGAVGAAGYGSSFLVSGGTSETARARVRIPRPASPAPATPAGVTVGVSSFVTPNKTFYRVDILLDPPRVDPKSWELRVHGMVERELRIDLENLVGRRLVERDITLTCVSNEVGGPYVGNARWIGVPLAEILREAGVKDGADAVKSTSVDGFTIGTPLEALTDGRDALLAFAMNGEPLPFDHGFPVRMVVPGLYGFVSATKWVVDLEVTRFADFSAYWTDRDWDEQAPIKTSSRIDVPKSFAALKAGPVAVAGVAWAQRRGIRKVEVKVDNGDWQPARLAAENTIDTWRQWVFRWDATPGNHTLAVRATDSTGRVQTADRARPRPNGSSGWHNVLVMVE